MPRLEKKSRPRVSCDYCDVSAPNTNSMFQWFKNLLEPQERCYIESGLASGRIEVALIVPPGVFIETTAKGASYARRRYSPVVSWRVAFAPGSAKFELELQWERWSAAAKVLAIAYVVDNNSYSARENQYLLVFWGAVNRSGKSKVRPVKVALSMAARQKGYEGGTKRLLVSKSRLNCVCPVPFRVALQNGLAESHSSKTRTVLLSRFVAAVTGQYIGKQHGEATEVNHCQLDPRHNCYRNLVALPESIHGGITPHMVRLQSLGAPLISDGLKVLNGCQERGLAPLQGGYTPAEPVDLRGPTVERQPNQVAVIVKSVIEDMDAHRWIDPLKRIIAIRSGLLPFTYEKRLEIHHTIVANAAIQPRYVDRALLLRAKRLRAK